MKDEARLRRILEESGYRITKPRLAVFHTLQRNHRPQSMTELATTLRGKVDRVSVYRTIDMYEQLGIVTRITTGWKYKLELSDMFLSHHHHITCLICERVVTIEESDETENYINSLGTTAGYTRVSHQLELQGYCDRCSV